MNITKSSIKSFLSLFAICRLLHMQTTNPLTLILFIVFIYIYSRFSQPSFEYRIGSADPIHSAIVSVIFTVLTLCATCYDLVSGLTNGFFCVTIWIISALGFLIIYYHVMIWLFAMLSPVKLDTTLYPNTLLPYIAFVACILAWLPYFLYEYPGVMIPTSISQYAQAIGAWELTNSHSIIYTICIGFFNSIGVFFFNSTNAGIAMFTFAQMIFMAFVAGYVIKTFQKASLNQTICIISIVFYALMPYIGMSSIYIVKDTLFAGNVIFLGASMLRLLIRNDRYQIKIKELFCEFIPYIISAVMVCLLRENGWYAFIVSVPFIIIGFREKLKMIIPVNIIAICIVLFIRYPFMIVYEIEQPEFIESVSVPLQQISRVIAAGQTLTEEEYNELSNYIDISLIPSSYTPSDVDSIKDLVRETGNGYIETHHKEFLALWFKIGLAHPHAYFDAYVDQTVGYWYPDIKNDIDMADGVSENNLGIAWKPLINGKAIVKIREALFKVQTVVPLYGLLWSIGFLFWVVIILISICFREGKLNNIVPLLPALFIMLTLCIATPVSNEFRYAYSLFFGLPLYIMLPFVNTDY